MQQRHQHENQASELKQRNSSQFCIMCKKYQGMQQGHISIAGGIVAGGESDIHVSSNQEIFQHCLCKHVASHQAR